MKTIYDPVNDALFVRFAEGRIMESEEITPGIIHDYDEEGRIIAIELLNAMTKLAKGVDLPGFAAGKSRSMAWRHEPADR